MTSELRSITPADLEALNRKRDEATRLIKELQRELVPVLKATGMHYDSPPWFFGRYKGRYAIWCRVDGGMILASEAHTALKLELLFYVRELMNQIVDTFWCWMGADLSNVQAAIENARHLRETLEPEQTDQRCEMCGWSPLDPPTDQDAPKVMSAQHAMTHSILAHKKKWEERGREEETPPQ